MSKNDTNPITGQELVAPLTQVSAERNEIPLCEGCFDYFPKALAEIAKFSKFGNDKHNPGEPLHWSRWQSTDHANKIAKHLLDRGTIDPDSGFLHDVALAWRALANLEVTLERVRNLPASRASRTQPVSEVLGGRPQPPARLICQDCDNAEPSTRFRTRFGASLCNDCSTCRMDRLVSP